ncbi:RagB/SusD family nutrient uptake outer membrane protein [Chryseobacterium lactis]|uniref:RagB/SusD family nutrient uptake outer membrane protein n=1 Tax=Chryseobacterium lactis TaxID=1241981 RepID=A0A3G6RIN2_CHRLC|nr:RagB/SusD family nutrient uptake outer membrane protein [Chryseobacterium lactis]AZA82425.1 RagB/SusD family nutrient uptake outer membrane protein [Chryseobacterium lactis]AZB02807.1 RagB/SusD family nutrient uptake outer membrane protein [Chryseobacterium lactis]PNW13899.1 RagB/SusD family nutrient uptake outer membrane protein [Chryseobacterium lactis]
MKKINFIILMIVVITAASCDRLLDVKTPDNQIDQSKVFEDVQTANAALAAHYADLMKSSPIAGGDLETYLSSYTDELRDYTTIASDSRDIFLNLHTDTNSVMLNTWATAYKHIYTANAILEGISGSHGITTSDKNWFRGQALLTRSIMFFYLNQLYGDIPYPESTDYKVNNVIAKTPSITVLTNLEHDLLEVSSLLQNDYKDPERIYPNRSVAKLLLAKVYMAEQNWNKAEILLKEITQNPIYQIESDITKVFTKSAKEVLWQLKPNNNTSLRQATSFYFTNSLPYSYALSESLINTFQDNDLRKQNWIGRVDFGGVSYYRVEKYKNRNNTNTNEYSIVFRLEEAYLLLAETLTEQNKINEALPYVNATRLRAQLAPLNLPISKDLLIQEILLEDNREFFVEMGHRFLDLKRAGKLNTLQTNKPNWKDFHQLWPVPQKEILLNANLKPQNTGY